jgi:hypothetical protein
MAPSESLPELPLPERPPTGLSFGDGFQFGCGFFIAGLIAAVVLILILALVALALSVTGFGLISSLLG